MDLEIRIIDLHDLRVDDGDNPTIRASIKFNRLSVPLWGFREKIAETAFDDTIEDREAEVLAYWNHNTDMPLGRRTAETVSISKSRTLFKTEIQPNMDTEWGRSAVASIRRMDVNGLSFGFRTPPDGDKWEEDDNQVLIRTLVRVKLIEVSPTPNPAYPASSAKVRSLDTKEIRAAIACADGRCVTSDEVKALLTEQEARTTECTNQIADRQRRDRLQREYYRQIHLGG